MKQYADSYRTFEILLQDSSLLPKSKENWNTFEPVEGDIAHIDDEDAAYTVIKGNWNKVVE